MLPEVMGGEGGKKKKEKPHLKNLLLRGDVRDKLLIDGQDILLREVVPNAKPVDQSTHIDVLDGPRDPEQLPVL